MRTLMNDMRRTRRTVGISSRQAHNSFRVERTTRAKRLVAPALVLLAVGCGSDSGSDGGSAGSDTTEPGSTTATIGPAGGQISVAGALLDIPEGALSQDVEITVRQSSASQPEGFEMYSAVYEFEPSGLTFERPVTVRIPYSGQDEPLVVFWSKADGPGYEGVPSRLVGDAVEAGVMHFSTGFVAHGLAGFWSLGSFESVCQSSSGATETGELETLWHVTLDDIRWLSEEEECGSCGNGLGTYCNEGFMPYVFDGTSLSVTAADGAHSVAWDPNEPDALVINSFGEGGPLTVRRSSMVDYDPSCVPCDDPSP